MVISFDATVGVSKATAVVAFNVIGLREPAQLSRP
jgi:hypothetical protein